MRAPDETRRPRLPRAARERTHVVLLLPNLDSFPCSSPRPRRQGNVDERRPEWAPRSCCITAVVWVFFMFGFGRALGALSLPQVPLLAVHLRKEEPTASRSPLARAGAHPAPGPHQTHRSQRGQGGVSETPIEPGSALTTSVAGMTSTP